MQNMGKYKPDNFVRFLPSKHEEVKTTNGHHQLPPIIRPRAGGRQEEKEEDREAGQPLVELELERLVVQQQQDGAPHVLVPGTLHLQTNSLL